MDSMDKQARDAVLIGLFFVGYGVMLAIASGVRIPRILIDNIDAKKLLNAAAQRDRLLREEGVPEIEIVSEGVASPNPETK